MSGCGLVANAQAETTPYSLHLSQSQVVARRLKRRVRCDRSERTLRRREPRLGVPERAIRPTFGVKAATRRLGVICSILLGRSFRNKSSNDMAFPHPKSRKDNHRKEDKPNSGGVLWNFFKRTINITEYRNAKDNVNAAKNRTFGGTESV